ncbi:MAG: leucine-rich repeat protein [Oscillospiraceae bacterium]|nr:leucine-rich repeat protein [Oscillospiraceae bacterium]
MKKMNRIRASLTGLALMANAVVPLFPVMQAGAVSTSIKEIDITAEHIVSAQHFFLNNESNVKMTIDTGMDMDGSGTVDAFDLAIMKKMFAEQEKESAAFYDQLHEMTQKYDGSGGLSLDEEYSGRVIVQAYGEYDFSPYSPLEVLEGPDHLYFLQFGSIEDTEKCLTALRRDDHIDYAELDAQISLPPSDEAAAASVMALEEEDFYSWGVTAIEADQYAEYLSEYHDSSVIVAVVDSGIGDHPFFEGKIMDGYDFVNGDHIPNEEQSHGTHVAGTVLDCMRGVDVKIMPIKVFGPGKKGSISHIVMGINYAVKHGANVINLSLGGDCSNAMHAAIKNAVQKGVTVIVSAGNDAVNTVDYCPAHLEDAIVVSAIDSKLEKYIWTNYGNSVDVTAPGVAVYNTAPNGTFLTKTGTSMSAPHISAAAAMIKYANPKAEPAEIEQLLKDISMDLGAKGRDNYFGYGLPQLSNLIPNNPDIVPSITISETAVSLNAGEKHMLTADTVPSAQPLTWTSSNEAVVSVDGGVITAVSEGTADVTASFIYNSVSYAAECTVTVIDLSNDILMEGQCGDEVYYSLDGNGLLSITGTGAMWDYSIPYIFELTEHVHGESPFKNNAEIKAVAVSEGVTSLGDCAFVGCSQLKEVALPDSLTHIENYVFYSCTSLEEINIPQNVEKIGDEEYVLDPIDETSSHVFYTSPAKVFSNCLRLKGVYVDDDNTHFADDRGTLITGDRRTLLFIPLGMNEYIMSDELTELADNCAQNHRGLTELIVPNSVISIGREAFKGCSNLKNVQLNAGLEMIHESAFRETQINSIRIPSSVIEIGYGAFADCESLTKLTFDKYGSEQLRLNDGVFANTGITSVSIPERTIGIAIGVFQDCSDLVSVEIPRYDMVIADTVGTLGTTQTVVYGYSGSTAEQHAALAGQQFVAFEKQIEIPQSGALSETVFWDYKEGVLTLSGTGEMPSFAWGPGHVTYVFFTDEISPFWLYRNEIKTIVIGEGITTIAQDSFTHCYNLEKVEIAGTVDYIDMNSFGFTGLKELVIPETVSMISNAAFCYANNLEKITFYNKDCKMGDVSSRSMIPESTTIYGYTGSTAEAYATQFNRSFVAID